MNPRKLALLEGKLQYSTNKPCRRGHTTMRYSSNGMCIGCLDHHKVEIAATIAQRRIANHMASVKKMVDRKVQVQLQYIPILDAISDIMMGDNNERIEALAQFILVIGTPTISTEQLQAVLRSDDGFKTMTNYMDFPMYNDDDGKLVIQINGEWYLGDDVVACVRGVKPTAHRLLVSKYVTGKL